MISLYEFILVAVCTGLGWWLRGLVEKKERGEL